MTQGPIGGFFELELSASGTFPHAGGYCYRSARTAFAALLACRLPRKVWVPRYICNAMIEPLIAANVPYCWYDITEQLDIARTIRLTDGDLLLYVNYFGICDRHIDAILADFGADKVVLDFSQAFFSRPRTCLATIYSARKFVGVPDGGLLHAKLEPPPAAQPYAARHEDMSHLVGRMIDGPEPHYRTFTDHEATFTDLGANAMSGLSAKILRSIDWQHTARRRAANFALLHELIGATNGLPILVAPDAAPLCYPYLDPRTPQLQRSLAARRVYTPLFWKEVVERSTAGSVETHLANYLLAIPCDQRYGAADMHYLASLITSFE